MAGFTACLAFGTRINVLDSNSFTQPLRYRKSQTTSVHFVVTKIPPMDVNDGNGVQHVREGPYPSDTSSKRMLLEGQPSWPSLNLIKGSCPSGCIVAPSGYIVPFRGTNGEKKMTMTMIEADHLLFVVKS